MPSYDNSFWGFFSVDTGEITEGTDRSHHGTLARELGYQSKENYIKKTNSVAFDVPIDYSCSRADFICKSTKCRDTIAAITQFLICYRNKYDIKYIDITGYDSLPLPVETVDEFFDKY
ncbi:hypothetical protein UFOVP434_91 [uncultured Caudovirales phage]|uniref:Uncharacterized protein n=1 Tax=uncultured Caudovirales phage TaxID=2100421 RepID=A0A6J5MAL6_9CAUD|nr:hypothetical protein UFOVP434_91 [uncultured Caudovirales phage]